VRPTKQTWTAAAASMLITVPISARAQDAGSEVAAPGRRGDPPPVLVTPYAGWHGFLQSDEGFLDNAVMGLRFHGELGRRLGLEGAVAYTQTTTDPTVTGADSGKPVHLVTGRIDLTATPLTGRFQPYFQVGIGFKAFTITDRATEEAARPGEGEEVLPQPKNPDGDFQVDAAAGLRLGLARRLSADVNLRYLMSLGPGEDFVNPAGTRTVKDRFDNLEATAGLAVRFGGPKDPPRVKKPRADRAKREREVKRVVERAIATHPCFEPLAGLTSLEAVTVHYRIGEDGRAEQVEVRPGTVAGVELQDCLAPEFHGKQVAEAGDGEVEGVYRFRRSGATAGGGER